MLCRGDKVMIDACVGGWVTVDACVGGRGGDGCLSVCVCGGGGGGGGGGVVCFSLWPIPSRVEGCSNSSLP